MGSPSVQVSMTVGQTLGIPSNMGGAGVTWQVDYDEDRLKLLTPRDQVSRPGTRGWVWRATAPGLVEINLTSRAPCPNPPCESNPARVTYTVEIKPRSRTLNR
jgi:hypothetical protein